MNKVKGVNLLSEVEDAKIMTPFDDYSVEELKNAYNRLFFLSDLNDADLAELEQILAALQKKDPLTPSRSVDELWDEFQTLYAPNSAELGIRGSFDSEEVVSAEPEPDTAAEVPSGTKITPIPRKRHRKIIRIGLIAAALVVVLAATAAAMGYNLWGWLPIWGDEELHFVAETPRQEATETVLHGIPKALESLGITEPLYPTWLPEDLERTEMQIIEDPMLLFEKFTGNDRRLSITISPASGFETTVYQKTGNEPVEYITHDVVHYIFDNTNELVSVWYTGNYTVLIAGNVSLDEMRKIIDSIYEVE
ncbi:MAG: DUF4367 domain-containing protein [Paludibacteraceae bacterium]|nr:DUF4367 domain-containing protein [Paludibacteraceae bacterium]